MENRKPTNKPSNRVSLKFSSTGKWGLPEYETSGAAGMDLKANLDSGSIEIEPGERVLIPTGLRMEIPHGYEAQVRPRSGLALKKGLTVANAPGTIDEDYRGEIGVILINLGRLPVVIEDGERIAQLVIAPVCRAEWVRASLSATDRGDGGFGHTG